MKEKIMAFYAENKSLVTVFGLIILMIGLAKYAIPAPKRRRRRATRTTTGTTSRTTGKRTGQFTMGVNGKLLRVPAGKRAYQVKGSVAARNRMRAIRKRR